MTAADKAGRSGVPTPVFTELRLALVTPGKQPPLGSGQALVGAQDRCVAGDGLRTVMSSNRLVNFSILGSDRVDNLLKAHI